MNIDSYFTHLKEQLFLPKSCKKFFLIIIKYNSIENLRSVKDFQRLKELALPLIRVDEIFSEIAVEAVQNDNLSLIKFLIEDCGFIELVKYKDKKNITLLHEACVYQASNDLVKYLLDHQADPNAVDFNQETPIHRVSRIDCPRLISLLADYKADLNLPDRQGLRPLHLAAMFMLDKNIKILIKRKANPNLEYLGMTYDQLQLRIKKGIYKVETENPPPANKKGLQNSIKGIIARFYAGLLLPKINQKLCQNLCKAFQSSNLSYNSDEFLELINIVFFALSADTALIISFIDQQLKSNKLTTKSAANAVIRLSKNLSQQSETCAIESYCDFALSIIIAEKNNGYHLTDEVNDIAFLFNSIGRFNKGKEAAQQGLLMAAASPGTDNQLRAYLHYNLAYSFKSQLKTYLAFEHYQQAFALVNDDRDILCDLFFAYVQRLDYKNALAVCQQSNCGQFSAALTVYCNYLLGNLTIEQLQVSLPNSTNDIQTEILVKDLQSECYKKIGNYLLAIEHALLSYQLYVAHKEFNLSQSITQVLKTYIECNENAAALHFLNKVKNEYPAIFSINILINCFAAIVYLANDLSAEAEIIINKIKDLNIDHKILAQLFLNLALYQDYTKSAGILSFYNYINLAIKFNPNLEVEVVKLFFSVLSQEENKFKEVQDIVDPDLLKNLPILKQDKEKILEENDEESAADISLDDYDPVKVHHQFQLQKKQSLSNLTNVLLSAPADRIKWLVNSITYSGSDDTLVNFSGIYADYFGVISPNLQLDNQTINRFQMALGKGVCKRRNQVNGVKFLNNVLVELKIDDDIRLYATIIYKNKENKNLIIFDKVGDHKCIDRLLKNKKKLAIIDLAATSRQTFFTADDTNNTSLSSQDEQEVSMLSNKL